VKEAQEEHKIKVIDEGIKNVQNKKSNLQKSVCLLVAYV
jgi:hypothetical protein